MTINNNPNALPSVTVVVFRLLRGARSPLSLEEISDLVAPESVVERKSNKPPKSLSDSVALMHEFGFLVDKGDQRFMLASLPEQDGSESDVDFLGKVFRQLFLAPEKNLTADKGLWDGDTGARDFTRGASWFLMQDVWSGPRSYEGQGDSPSVQQEQNTQLEGREGRKQTLFNSSIRWDAFARWAQFTGIARKDSEGLIPDPSRAIADVMSEMTVTGMAPVGPFLKDLGVRLPVIDGGIYWEEVRSRTMGRDKDAGQRRVSSSLTHALRRLENAGRIRIRNEADAPDKLVLATAFSQERTESVSHIEVLS